MLIDLGSPSETISEEAKHQRGAPFVKRLMIDARTMRKLWAGCIGSAPLLGAIGLSALVTMTTSARAADIVGRDVVAVRTRVKIEAQVARLGPVTSEVVKAKS